METTDVQVSPPVHHSCHRILSTSVALCRLSRQRNDTLQPRYCPLPTAATCTPPAKRTSGRQAPTLLPLPEGFRSQRLRLPSCQGIHSPAASRQRTADDQATERHTPSSKSGMNSWSMVLTRCVEVRGSFEVTFFKSVDAFFVLEGCKGGGGVDEFQLSCHSE